MTFLVVSASPTKRYRARQSAASAPVSCAMTNMGTSWGRMPANVSESERAIVIAGFAKDVEAVNQYAAPIHAATIQGASTSRR